MSEYQLVYTNEYAEAIRLRDQGYEPIECAFGQYGSVLGPLAMDHHGAESHREGVAIRACRDNYGARRQDPRFVVTGTPDADATLAIIALAGLVSAERLRPAFYEVVNAHDTDPIGLELLGCREGELLAWFNQQPNLPQSAAGFRKAIGHLRTVLNNGLTEQTRAAVHRADHGRRKRAREGMLSLTTRDGLDLPIPAELLDRPVLRGEAAVDAAARILVVQSTVWGFDLWYRAAPIVVSFAARLGKVTVGCPDVSTAEALFGPGGLSVAWRALGRGWGGRESIGGSPRGVILEREAVFKSAETVRACLLR